MKPVLLWTLEAAEEVRAVPRNPGMVPKAKFTPDE
jgi:hypothetical protein